MKVAISPLALLLTVGLFAGCQSNQSKPEGEAQPAAQSASTAPAAAPVEAAPAKPVCPPEAPKSTAKTKNTKDSKSKTTAKTATAKKADPDCVPAGSAPTAAAAPAAGAKSPYDLSKNKPVTDSTKVEAGQGTSVKGLNDWQGEVTGLPVAGSKFTRLQIGMPMKQVTDLIGEPTDQGAYITGKAFIPLYFGSDKSRWEMTYKGQGRLLFSNQAGFGTGYYLTWIIYNQNEPGYR